MSSIINTFLTGFVVYLATTMPFIFYPQYGLFVCFVSKFELSSKGIVGLLHKLQAYERDIIVNSFLRLSDSKDLAADIEKKSLSMQSGVAAIALSLIPITIGGLAYLTHSIRLVSQGKILEFFAFLFWAVVYVWTLREGIQYWGRLKYIHTYT